MSDEEYTTIRITQKTKSRLQRYGLMGEDYEAVLDKVLNLIEKRKASKEGQIK